MPGRIMVLLVCTGSVLSALGIFEPLVEYAHAGVTVPLIGFGHLLYQGVKEAIGTLIVEFGSYGKAPLVEMASLDEMAERYRKGL